MSCQATHSNKIYLGHHGIMGLRQSELFARTSKSVAKEELSINAQLLTRAGYVNRLMAGVYSFLPLGVRTLSKIENIIREEMLKIGSQEVLLPALQPRENWDKTGRWDKVDVLFKFKGHGDRDLTLGPTHEEVVTPLVGSFIQSYRDLPISVFQIQTKFRDEARAKSGLLRGREFRMKDMYSFHSTQEDLDAFYEEAVKAYNTIFERCGIGKQTLMTYASGGVFSKYSHEFQTITPHGEDLVYEIPDKRIAINREIINDPEVIAELIPGMKPEDLKQLERKSIEVGNIFKLGTRFSSAFNSEFVAQDGQRQTPVMGCYGLGPTRLLGTMVEILHDENGLKWPTEVAPFKVHLVSLARTDAEVAEAEQIYDKLQLAGMEVLYDDRINAPAGEKFKDSDLLGMPYRVVVSQKTLAQGRLELKPRDSKEASMVTVDELLNMI